VETQLLLAKDLAYIEQKDIRKIEGDIREVERMLKALIKALEEKKK
jgi:four helix bundle protein